MLDLTRLDWPAVESLSRKWPRVLAMEPGRQCVAGFPGAHTLSTRNSTVHSPTSGRSESLAARISGAVVVGVGKPPAHATIEQRRRAARTLGITEESLSPTIHENREQDPIGFFTKFRVDAPARISPNKH